MNQRQKGEVLKLAKSIIKEIEELNEMILGSGLDRIDDSSIEDMIDELEE